MRKPTLSLVPLLLVSLLVAACGPWGGRAPNGKLGVAWFSTTETHNGYKGQAIAAAAAHVEFDVGGTRAVRFRSAAEDLFTVTDDGLVTTHAPGEADLIAVDAATGNVVDLITLRLVATHSLKPAFETEPLLLAGWKHRV